MIFSMISFFCKLWRRPLLRIFISVSVLVILFSILPLSKLWHTVRQIPIGLWIFAVAATVVVHSVGVIKWSLLINATNNKLPLFSAFRCYFAGLFANIFLPSVNGGDIVRAGLAIKLNKEKEAVILGSLTDRVIDASALALIVLSGTLLLPKMASAGIYRILLGIVIVLLFFVLFCAILLVAPIPLKTPKFVARSISRFRYTIRELIKNPWRVIIALSVAIIMQMWFIFLFSVFGEKLGIHLSLPIWFIVWPTAKLSAMLPISLGGLGVREAALAVLLSQFDVSLTGSVGLGLLWESLFFAVGGVGGIFYFISMNNLSRSGVMVTKGFLNNNE